MSNVIDYSKYCKCQKCSAINNIYQVIGVFESQISTLTDGTQVVTMFTNSSVPYIYKIKKRRT